MTRPMTDAADRRGLVVTGYGSVSSLGDSAADTYAAWAAGTCAIAPIRRFDTSALDVHLGGEMSVPDELTRELSRRGECRGRRALRSALDEALAAAELPTDARTLVLCGTAKGFLAEGREVADRAEAHDVRTPTRWLAREVCRRFPRGAVAGGSAPEDPVLNSVAVPVAGAVPAWTLSIACASGSATLAAALGMAETLADGRHDAIICASVDLLSDFVYRGFAALRAVDPEPCRPFDRTRAGMSPAEGAAAIVLETAESAERRGATVLGRILGAGSSCDAAHATAPDREAGGMRRSIRAALAAAGTSAHELGHIHAHGTATPFNDAMELHALDATFAGTERPPLTTLKGNAGHAFGAAGLIEFIASLEAVRHGAVPAIAGLRAPEQAWPLVGETIPAERSRFLKLSAGFGGFNVALVGEGVPA